uniref:Uncharacterized protein n=1 Tax=Siphoviridae sp. ctvI513 TaxID=2827965 RepID=A0A8S5TJ88_9CAUD|nr:MAG TPA: hypothetical protein [Siphoviridae sp. ctvI513]
MKKYYHVITERNDEYVSTVAIADSIETVKAHFAGQNIHEIIELNAAQVNTIFAAATTTIIDITAEQDNAPATPDYTVLAETIRAELNARHDRSAWNKAVTLYALDLLDDVQEGADNMERLPLDGAELERWALNGASCWEQYSNGGCSICYDADIAARVCTPSELKRKHGGAYEPNSRETWLNVQARALYQACNRIRKICRANGLYYKEV